MEQSIGNKRFIAQIAHDMRSLVAVLRSFFTCMDLEPDEADIAELKEAACRSVTKLQCLVEMLDAPTSSVHPKRQWIDVADMICLTVKELKALTNPKDIEIIYVGVKHMTAFVDPFLINRVLVNLVVNAVQAINGGDGVIRVGLFHQDDTVYIEISDNGCGIDPEHINRIFEHGFTFGKKDGTGIGLDICRQITEAHAGKIEVHSIPKRGTVFTATLPYSTDSSYIPENHNANALETTLD